VSPCNSLDREFLEAKRVAGELIRAGNLIHEDNGRLTPAGWALANLKARLKDERKRVPMDQPERRAEMRRLISGISQCLTKSRRRWERKHLPRQ
jgi:hypothetical protein